MGNGYVGDFRFVEATLNRRHKSLPMSTQDAKTGKAPTSLLSDKSDRVRRALFVFFTNRDARPRLLDRAIHRVEGGLAMATLGAARFLERCARSAQFIQRAVHVALVRARVLDEDERHNAEGKNRDQDGSGEVGFHFCNFWRRVVAKTSLFPSANRAKSGGRGTQFHRQWNKRSMARVTVIESDSQTHTQKEPTTMKSMILTAITVSTILTGVCAQASPAYSFQQSVPSAGEFGNSSSLDGATFVRVSRLSGYFVISPRSTAIDTLGLADSPYRDSDNISRNGVGADAIAFRFGPDG